jgi:hypothetical protein
MTVRPPGKAVGGFARRRAAVPVSRHRQRPSRASYAPAIGVRAWAHPGVSRSPWTASPAPAIDLSSPSSSRDVAPQGKPVDSLAGKGRHPRTTQSPTPASSLTRPPVPSPIRQRPSAATRPRRGRLRAWPVQPQGRRGGRPLRQTDSANAASGLARVSTPWAGHGQIHTNCRTDILTKPSIQK